MGAAPFVTNTLRLRKIIQDGSDGVPCEPGSLIRNDKGEWYICKEGKEYVKWEPSQTWVAETPQCPPESYLVWDSTVNNWACSELNGTIVAPKREPEIFKPAALEINTVLWVVLVMAGVFTMVALGMGVTEWWKRRKRKREAAVEEADTRNFNHWFDSILEASKLPPPIEFTEAEMKLEPVEIKPGVWVPKAEGSKSTQSLSKTTQSSEQTVKEVKMAEPVDKNPDSLQDEIKEIYSLIQLARNDVNKIPGFLQVSVNSAMDNLNKARDRVAALGGKVK